MIIHPTTVTVVVLSYNRPRMLAEALQSIKGADEVLVVDDGSSFNVQEVVLANAPDNTPLKIHKKPDFTHEERLVTPRVGKNMNEAIQNASSDVIAYLCDDDVFAPGWIPAIKDYYNTPGMKEHWIRGWWGKFVDPHNPLLDPTVDLAHHLRCNLCPMAGHGLTTGSFAQLKICSFKCNVWWSEKSVSIHDSYFVANYGKIHNEDRVPLIDTPAGWRREHPFNMMKHVSGADHYLESGKEILREGFLE